jgi:hypothetical protein
VISFVDARIGEADLYRRLSGRQSERLRNGRRGAKRTDAAMFWLSGVVRGRCQTLDFATPVLWLLCSQRV